MDAPTLPATIRAVSTGPNSEAIETPTTARVAVVHLNLVKLKIGLRTKNHARERTRDQNHRLGFHANKVELPHHITPGHPGMNQAAPRIPTEQRYPP